MFSSSFMVPGLTFTFLIHFTLVYGMRKWSSFISCSVFPTQFMEKVVFSHGIFLPPLINLP